MAGGRQDLVIVGGGLAGSLLALALRAARPDLRLLILEAGERLGGNHVWSFFASDVGVEDRPLIDPLIANRWSGYEVRFPAHSRGFDNAYHSITSERLDAHVRACLPADAIRTSAAVREIGPMQVLLVDGERIDTGGVIDARGAGDLSLLSVGWQKFLGQELRLDHPHGMQSPIVMDATVPQIDGYRFVYVLPFGPDRLFVEDTYYSREPALDPAVLRDRIAAYADAQGWRIAAVEREETGVLPVTMGGDFAAYWRSTGGDVAKIGARAGLFHPTTGYSLPDAVRTARLVAGMADLSGPGLARALHDHARRAWESRGFYRLLDRMLFRAAGPDERYKVLERFYRLDRRLIERFYAGRSTMADKLRILTGRPPVPIVRAVRAILEAA